MIGDHLCTEDSHLVQLNLVFNQKMLKLRLHLITILKSLSGTFPIDTTKTRLQIQGQKLDGRFTVVRYNGMFHALSRITREEGVRALYSGYFRIKFS